MADHDRRTDPGGQPRSPGPGGPPDAETIENLQEAFEGTDSDPSAPPAPQEPVTPTPPQDPVEALAHEPAGTAAGPADAAEAAEAADAAEELAALRAERDEYLDHVRRLQADFDNYRKRMLRDQTMYLERATEGLVEQLLPVLDAFELALLNSGTDPERLRKGVELVYSELLGVLEKAGLERIDAQGKPFDPSEHEAVMHVEGAEPGVVDVVRTGYRLKGRVLRPAMVKVAT
jgi:molecular chaperone GrpE